MFEVIAQIQTKVLEAPITLGTIIIHNVAGTGANIVATRTVERRTTDEHMA
jgi:CxxC motif-containing protein